MKTRTWVDYYLTTAHLWPLKQNGGPVPLFDSHHGFTIGHLCNVTKTTSLTLAQIIPIQRAGTATTGVGVLRSRMSGRCLVI